MFMTKKYKNPPIHKNFDYLTPLLTEAPAAWALIRANEIRALERVDFVSPVLDVGCGDGLVAKVLLSNRKGTFDWGTDLSAREIAKAKKTKSYRHYKVASVYDLPFKDGSFETVFSNSVIEHIPNLEQALSEMSRVLKKGGKLIITVPSPYIGEYLLGRALLGQTYINTFNKLFKHYNLHDHNGWRKKMSKHSLKLVDYHYYHSSRMIKMHEFLSYVATPTHLLKPILGHWKVFPEVRTKALVPWLKPLLMKFYLEEASLNKGGSVLLVAQKTK